MQTVHDLQEQQVLDNLAMFVANPCAMPYFSLASQGSSGVTDMGSLSIGNQLARTAANLFEFTQLMINPSLSRSAAENWTLNPINDSVKLSLMRCAYQRSIGACCSTSPSCDCPNCNALMTTFYQLPPQAPLPLTSMAIEGCPCGPTGIEFSNKGAVADETAKAASTGGSSTGLSHVAGTNTPFCLDSSHCWFCWGPKSAVPKDCCCYFVGHYCDTYVWVPPSGRDQLTKLTLLIVDIAYYDPAPGDAASTIEITIPASGCDGPMADGLPATSDFTRKPADGKSVYPVSLKATVPLGTDPDAVLYAPEFGALNTLLSAHGMSIGSLIDYWSRGVAGPRKTQDDVNSRSLCSIRHQARRRNKQRTINRTTASSCSRCVEARPVRVRRVRPILFRSEV
jgi:hypothetical protein